MAEPAEYIESFIARWQGVAASELATAQSFVTELCRILDVESPTHQQDYMFERPITFRHGDGGVSAGRIDCYRRGCFVLEAKKLKVSGGGTPSKGFDDALLRARSQAEGYARALPAEEGRAVPDRRRCRQRHRAVRRIHPHRRHLRSLSRSALAPHPAGRPAGRGHSRASAFRLARSAGARPDQTVRARYP